MKRVRISSAAKCCRFAALGELNFGADGADCSVQYCFE